MNAGVATWAPEGTITAVSTGVDTTCAIAGGVVYCWGDNPDGQLGNGTTNNSLLPVAVNATTGLLGKTATRLLLSPDGNSQGHACTLASGVMYCWAHNSNGRLGNGDTVTQLSPVAVSTATGLAGKTLTSIGVGSNHTCTVASGLGYCWGYNASGQLGIGSTSTSINPTAVVTTVTGSGTLTQVAGGNGVTCAVANSLAYCWGSGTSGQLGYGGTSNQSSPIAVSTAGVLGGKTVTAVGVGQAYSCALASGLPYCWGSDSNGRLGNGPGTNNSTVPDAVVSTMFAGKTVSRLAVGRTTACVLANDEMYCWGVNGNGQLGDGTTTMAQAPSRAGDTGPMAGKSVTVIADAVLTHNCAVANNQLFCWGDNTAGKLGNNSTGASLVPDYVRQRYDFDNSGYRLYQNQNSATPGAPLAATNTPAQITEPNQAFRLRTDIGSTAGGIVVGDNSFKLQFAVRSAGACSTQITGWNDVTGSTTIAWNTNAGVGNGASISAHGNDPIGVGNIVVQNYRSAGGTFSNTNYIDDGKSGLWDFSLRDNGMTPATQYCLRLAYNNGTELEAATVYPEVSLAGELTVDIVTAGGMSVANPQFGFESTYVQPLCQLTTGVFGTSAQRLRVFNSLSTTGWSVSIAATGGHTAVWQPEDPVSGYDFNDPSGSPAGCNSGSDGDGLAGQLTINPSTATISPQSGCSNNGISRGTSVAFNQETVNAITLLSASSSTPLGCYWDIMGIDMAQRIPANQPNSVYTIDMTVTVVAQ